MCREEGKCRQSFFKPLPAIVPYGPYTNSDNTLYTVHRTD